MFVKQLMVFPQVPVSVGSHFIAPKFGSSRRYAAHAAIEMSMPKASMNENNGGIFGQYYVGTTRQSVGILPETEAFFMKKGTDGPFYECVFVTDSRHQDTALAGGQVVWHFENLRVYADYNSILVGLDRR